VAVGAGARRRTGWQAAPAPDAAAGRAPTLTPDGRHLVYPGSAATERRLFVRPVGELRARPLAGTEGALSAFVSPDGRRIGFFTSDDKLKTVSVDGGPPSVLAGTFRFGTGSWGADDVLVVAHRSPGLAWIPAAGGTLQPLTQLDAARRETRHSAPLVLADGRTVLFTVERDRGGPVPSAGELAVASLDGRGGAPVPYTRLGVRGGRAVAVEDGWLLFTSGDGAMLSAVRFDPARRRAGGAPVTVLQDPAGGIEDVSLARDGTLLYTRRSDGNAPVLVDAAGTPRPLPVRERGAYMNPRLSPDGRRLAIQGATPQGSDVWIYDLASGARTRLTASGSAIGPTWTPDGRRVVFLSDQGGQDALWWQPADGGGAAERLVVAGGAFAAEVTPDGRTLLFQRRGADAWGLWAADLVGGRAMRPLVTGRFDSFMPSASPDGRWLAYAANASGRHEVYVRPLAGPDAAPRGTAVQVSDGGGTEPAWSPDGARLFYRGDRRLIAARVTTRLGFAVTARDTLFTEAFDGDMPMPHRNYDVTRDGRHFVMIASRSDAALETVVVLGWRHELRARLAAPRAAVVPGD
jgi:dipeptidyl aminopeptidase/acylaminoacyl peptidase